MAQRKTLTEAQVELLRWVGEGCRAGVYEGWHHHIAVAALQRRGLVVTSGRGEYESQDVVEIGSTVR